MNQITRLRDTLKLHLGWHGARLSFLPLFLISLLHLRSLVTDLDLKHDEFLVSLQFLSCT